MLAISKRRRGTRSRAGRGGSEQHRQAHVAVNQEKVEEVEVPGKEQQQEEVEVPEKVEEVEVPEKETQKLEKVELPEHQATQDRGDQRSAGSHC